MLKNTFILTTIILTLALLSTQFSPAPNNALYAADQPNYTPQPINLNDITSFENHFNKNRANLLMQNAISKVDVKEIALNRSIVTGMDHTFSNTLDKWKVTDQHRSGRCWMFAGLNLMRVDAMKQMTIENFELSQNHTMFFDKLEKSNYFLESIIETANRPPDDRTVHFLLKSLVSDGGQWNMFSALISKYGVVPKSVMPETHSSSNTRSMNRILRRKLREGARDLRVLHARNASPSDIQNAKQNIMTEVYKILAIHLGNPPKQFLWQWTDKDKNFHRDGMMTPQSFAKKYVNIPFNEYVCLVHDPRETSPTGRTFTVEYLGNVIGTGGVKYLNVDIDVIKKITMQSILNGQPVWFGCDTGKMMDTESGTWDKNLFDYKGVYSTDFKLTKAERLVYGESAMTHAMVFTGVDVVDGKPRRWRVENSWGEDVGKKGYFLMNDSWFDEYVYEIAAHVSMLSPELKKAHDQKPIVLPAWDPMGSLAR